MNKRSNMPIITDPYCNVCSSISGNKRLSSYSCDHCHLYMCYYCYEKHQSKLTNEYSQLEKHFLNLKNLFHNKKELFSTFEEYCLRNVNSTFDEIIHDLENLRKESLDYVKQEFHETQVSLFSSIEIKTRRLFSLDCSIRYDYKFQTFDFKII